MAFETNTLINGEWTTRTLDINTVLKHFDQEGKETNIRDLDIERAPTLGLLTQTVIRSPLVHWILPARLRNPERNDVAFIGVRLLLYCSFFLFDCYNSHFFFSLNCKPFPVFNTAIFLPLVDPAIDLEITIPRLLWSRPMLIEELKTDVCRMILFKSRNFGQISNSGMSFERRTLEPAFEMLVYSDR